MTSAPPSPAMTSLPVVPSRVSSLSVPTTVGTRPKQVSGGAVVAVPVGVGVGLPAGGVVAAAATDVAAGLLGAVTSNAADPRVTAAPVASRAARNDAMDCRVIR